MICCVALASRPQVNRKPAHQARRSGTMNSDEAAGRYYDSARSELIERIGLRDNALILYLGAVGAIFGVVYGSERQPLIVLLLIPFLALGAAFIISQHHEVIGALGRYLGRELEEHLRGDSRNPPPQWDTSDTLREHFEKAMRLRLWSHLLLLLVPSAVALLLNREFLAHPSSHEGVFWWFGAVCTGATLWPLISAHASRLSLYKQIPWRRPASPKA